MPPKLFLNVAASVQSLRPGGGATADDESRSAALLAPSIEIGPSGTLKLGGAFEFNPLGMKRNLAIAPLGAAAPLGEGAAGLQASYRVRGWVGSAVASEEDGQVSQGGKCEGPASQQLSSVLRAPAAGMPYACALRLRLLLCRSRSRTCASCARWAAAPAGWCRRPSCRASRGSWP